MVLRYLQIIIKSEKLIFMQVDNYFGCRYPIVCMAMNKVSDLNLALAVRRAGALPSLSIFNYNNIDLLEQDLIDYKRTFNDLKILLSISVKELIELSICNLIIKYKVEFLELIQDTPGEDINRASPEEIAIKKQIEKENLKFLRNNNIIVFLKISAVKKIDYEVDGVILKGQEGAGRGNFSLENLFAYIKEYNSKLLIIASGGIGNSKQIKYYIDNGAIGVGIGTMFAVSEESKISKETKLKMIAATSNDITRFTTGSAQNALVFEELSNDTFNHSFGLAAGVTGATSGHILVGKSIDYINSIKPVAEIIEQLIE